MLRNMVRASALDSDFYDLVERDPAFNRQAFYVVLIAAAFAGIGAWIGLGEVVGSGLWRNIRGWLAFGTWAAPNEGGLPFVLVANVALALVGWVVWAATTGFIGSRVFHGTTDFGEMLRVLGFAQAPRLIAVVPLLDPVAAVWTLVASVVAIRQGLDFNTARAVATAVAGWVVWLILQYLTLLVAGTIFG
jgi:hypothetical protein